MGPHDNWAILHFKDGPPAEWLRSFDKPSHNTFLEYPINLYNIIQNSNLSLQVNDVDYQNFKMTRYKGSRSSHVSPLIATTNPFPLIISAPYALYKKFLSLSCKQVVKKTSMKGSQQPNPIGVIAGNGSDDTSSVSDITSEFEFGHVTPVSPTNDPNKTSPADILFFNGVLRPHAFPFQPVKSTGRDLTRGTSHVSSVSSKEDSLMSSRSNSNNSRSSSCSSARTSLSENGENSTRRSVSSNLGTKTPITGERKQAIRRPASLQSHGSTQQWKFITPAPPVLISLAEIWCRKKLENAAQEDSKLKKSGKEDKVVKSWFGRKIFRSFVLACKECHALEPSNKEGSLR